MTYISNITSELEIESYVKTINDQLSKLKKSIFSLSVSISDCCNNIQDNDTQKEISKRLGVSHSYFSKLKSIGSCELIRQNHERLPPTINGLYNFTNLFNTYRDNFGLDEGTKKCLDLIGTEITPTSRSKDIYQLVVDLKKDLSRKKRTKQKSFDTILDDKTETTTLDDLIENQNRFNSFLICLNGETLKKYKDYLTSDIQEDFPLCELRDVTVTGKSVNCLMKLPINKLDIGIQILKGFGFNYRNTFIPHQPTKGFQHIGSDTIIVHGQRGSSKSHVDLNNIKSSEVEDLMSYSDQVFDGPHLNVFDDTIKEGWKCIIH